MGRIGRAYRSGGEWAEAGFLAALLLLALLPLVRLGATAFFPRGVFDPGTVMAAVSSRAAARALVHSLETSLLGGFGALLLGSAVALALALTDAPHRRAIAFLFLLSTMMAPQVIALAFLTMTGPASPILGALGLAPAPGSANPLTGRWGIVFLLALHHAPLVFVTVRAGLRNLPRDLIEAARASGEKPPRIVVRIVLPLVRPHLVAGAALAFVASVGNFGIPALLGMGHGYLTLPTLIYETLTSNGPGVLAEVAALSTAVAALAVVGLVLSAASERRGTARLAQAVSSEGAFALGPWRLPVAAALWGLVGIVLVLPVASLLAAALVPAWGVPLGFATATLDNFVEVVVRQQVTSRALVNSFLYAGTAAVILAIVAVPVARFLGRGGGRRSRLVEMLLELPFALPGIVLAIATILVFLKPLPIVGIGLYGTAAIIVVAYLARFAILAVRAPLAAVRQMPADLEEAARASGARHFRRLVTIVAPIVAPATMAGGLIVFLTAFNELTVSALLWSAGTETMGVVLYNLEDGGYGTLAAAVGVVSVGVVAVAMLGLDLAARRLPRGVVPWR